MVTKLIGISEELKKKLDSMKRYSRETYGDVIENLIDDVRMWREEPFEYMGLDSKNKPQYRRKFKQGEVLVPASLLPGEEGYGEQEKESAKRWETGVKNSVKIKKFLKQKNYLEKKGNL